MGYFTPVADIAFNNLQVGRKTVTTGGTPEQLQSASKTIRYVVIQGLDANTGLVYLGASNSVSSSNGFQLDSGASLAIPIDNLNKIWLDVDTNGDGVCFYYLENQ